MNAQKMKIVNSILLISCMMLFIKPEVVESSKQLRRRRSIRNLPHMCLQPQDTGMCMAYFINYYYNPVSEKCETFIYGGCGGNENNFWSLNDCQVVCEGKKRTDQIDDNGVNVLIESLQPLIESKDDCEYPPETGDCRAAFQHYYFNGEKCEQFTYGGCGGNPNNFQTEEECIARCVVHPENNSEENEI